MDKIKLRSYLLNALFALVVYGILHALLKSGVINPYYRGVILLIGINAIVTIGLNLATGMLGELCLGHAGFMAVGAYTSALFTLNSGLPGLVGLIPGLILGGLLAAATAALVGVPALRLRGDYLAIITLAFGEIISVLLRSFAFTGGARGLNGIPLLTNFPLVYWILVLTIVAVYMLIRSRHGRAILAIREDDIAAEASGINVTRFKMTAFVISAAIAGIGGGLYAHYIGILSPNKFNYNYSIDYMVMVVFGGMGSITGSILSAGTLTILPELLRRFADYRMLVYSVLLILLMIFKPEGLLGQKEFSQRFAANLIRRLTGREQRSAASYDRHELSVARETTRRARERGYLTEQGPGDLGVGGRRRRPEENIPVAGTAVAESEGRTLTRQGLDAGSYETAERKGRR